MPTNKPNVIIIITDDQGYGDLGCHGNPVAQTPHLDTLYAESVRFSDFHSSPMCTPTRGQLLTGMDAARNGAVNVSSGRSLLRANLRTMADLFLASGYSTGIFGKWHLGDNYPYRPQDRGFEESLWFPSSHISSLPDYWENDYFDDVYCHNGSRERYTGYCTEVFFERAKGWMTEKVADGRPFFAYLPTNAPHYPLWVPEEDRKAIEKSFAEGEELLPKLRPEFRERIVRFLAMIRNVDTEVGRLRDFLSEEGIDKNTLLIFMTDNGSTFGPVYYNAGMRGGKCTLWEGGHRVPCFVHWPEGGFGEPRDLDGLAQVQDILPTLVDLCSLEAPTNESFDGVSLAAALRGNGPVPEDRMLMVNYSRMPRGDYPTPDCESIIRREGTAVLWRKWRLLEGTALYNLDEDPEQQSNIIEQHPDIARAMTMALDDWWRKVEPFANQVQRVIIGSDEENPMLLSACEWQDVFVDQQYQVRIAECRNSYWNLQVEQTGTYRFELRRWPRESGLALSDGCPATVVTDGELEEGEALSISRARILIDRIWYAQPIQDGQASTVFTVQLQAGPVRLHTWFDDDRQQPICGAYYVYVSRLDEESPETES